MSGKEKVQVSLVTGEFGCVAEAGGSGAEAPLLPEAQSHSKASFWDEGGG